MRSSEGWASSHFMFPEDVSIASRFKRFRERAGLGHDQVAAQVGLEIGASAIWDIESHEDELSSCYSPAQVRRFCDLLRVTPAELFGMATPEPPISPRELVRLIDEECRRRHVSVEQFEDAVGWSLVGFMDPPERLFQDMTVDGLQWLCRELRVDWQRVMLGL
jgi:hypothetical protein